MTGRAALDRTPAVVLTTAAVVLTLQEYVGRRRVFYALLDAFDLELGAGETLASYAWWSGWCVVDYVVLPSLAWWALGRRAGELGWSPRGLWGHLPAYAALTAAALPLVVLGSFDPAFRATYPFYRDAHLSAGHLAAWEAMYLLQFVALEFFFRGFLVRGLEGALGPHAVFVAVVPYCMVHFGKPWPEVLLAVVAGVVLGTASQRTRSIWGGVGVHATLAVAMDLLAVRARG